MRVASIHDKRTIENFLKRNVNLHIYSIGDLDDFFWPYTVWFGSYKGTDLEALVLLYMGGALPVLLAFSEQTPSMCEFLESVQHLLPSHFYAHLSPGLESLFSKNYDVEFHGEHHKMVLHGLEHVKNMDCTGVERLENNNLKEILDFYEKTYPGNWFDPRMLETKQYFGIREECRLVSVAGVHVYSLEYKVASLGNIATLPSCRGKGYAKKVTARTCQSLSKDVLHIGLNVKSDNHAAISCYQRLGFEIIASYGEFMFNRKNDR